MLLVSTFQWSRRIKQMWCAIFSVDKPVYSYQLFNVRYYFSIFYPYAILNHIHILSSNQFYLKSCFKLIQWKCSKTERILKTEGFYQVKLAFFIHTIWSWLSSIVRIWTIAIIKQNKCSKICKKNERKREKISARTTKTKMTHIIFLSWFAQ